MITRVCLGFLLLAAAGAWSQSGGGTTPGANGSENSSEMLLPPQISGRAFPTEIGSEVRSNYISMAIAVTTAYDNNVIGAGGTKPVSDISCALRPSLSLDETTTRQTAEITYGPGFTFYEPTSVLNASNQLVDATYRYRLSPHAGLYANESFVKTSNTFNQPYALSGGPVTGSPQASNVVSPFAAMQSNSLSGGVQYQFRLNAMIGAAGSWGKLSYPDRTENAGFYDADMDDGSAFLSARLTKGQYLGFKYEYDRTSDSLAAGKHTSPELSQGEAQIHFFSPFYTVFFSPTLSISLSVGPQYLIASAPGTHLGSNSWGPSAIASIGWQGMRASFAASFLHAVTGGAGLVGAYDTNRGDAAARWKISPAWAVEGSGQYQIQKDTAPAIFAGALGGHTLSGGASLSRALRAHFDLIFGYNHIHQAYAGIPSIAHAPDDNHEYISISYQLTRPVGR